MGDVYKEQIVKKLPSTKDTLKKAGVICLMLVVSFVSFFIPLLNNISFIIVFALAALAYFIFSFFNVEYEYILTNGDLDIDAIYSKTRRKRMYSGSVKEFEVMAHVEDKAHTNDFNAAMETKDYSSGQVKPNTYAFLATYKGKKSKIIFEPNDVMVQAISTQISRSKFFKKI